MYCENCIHLDVKVDRVNQRKGLTYCCLLKNKEVWSELKSFHWIEYCFDKKPIGVEIFSIPETIDSSNFLEGDS